MKIHIDEISDIAAANADFIKSIDIIEDNLVGFRFSYLPMVVKLRFVKFDNGVIVFEGAGSAAARKLISRALEYIEEHFADALSGILSVSGDLISIRINEFIRNTLPGVKGLELSDFDIIGKEIVISLYQR